ncbi:MAG: hypothetical protein PHW82_16060 [Bacteroidales bacterium]|nr:hypothetical protein [Bacteroidales bacterium]
MKTETIILAFFTILFTFSLASCQNDEDFIVGKWKIESIAPTNADVVKSDMDVVAFAVLNMLSVDDYFEFNENGEFKIGKSSGTYLTSSNGESITLKDSESEQTFELITVSENKVKLKPVTDNTTEITLVRE